MRNKNMKYKKFKPELCDDSMTFQDCELAILRNAVDKSEQVKGDAVVNTEEIKKIISILEEFIAKKKSICYGGTAINNILPKYAQFYNKDYEIPDYDFFSKNALEDAKELADIYYSAGYDDVEAKSGIHYGTFKIFVNFIPIADITYLHPIIFDSLYKESIQIAGIHYASANYLRMSIYLELSRPSGDVSRWEKIFKRLVLLNKYYPFNDNLNCDRVDFQRDLMNNQVDSEKIYYIIRDTFIDLGVVFFGGYASSLYSKYMPLKYQKIFQKIPDFDVLSEDPERTSLILREQLTKMGYKNVKEIIHEEVGEIIPEHIEICIGKDTVAYIYYPIACHNYNIINIHNKSIRVATIDTMLSFYIAFTYSDEFTFFRDRVLCMAQFLFDVQEKNRLEQRGLLKRFSINCIGKQHTMEEIRSERAAKYKELRNTKDKYEYDMWFLKYIPREQGKKGKKPAIKDKDASDATDNTQTKKEKKAATEDETILEAIEKENEPMTPEPGPGPEYFKKKNKKTHKLKKYRKYNKKNRTTKGYLY